MLYRVTLHLARHPLFPEGSERHGYEMVVPLTADGRLDSAEWGAHKADCRVRRFWAGLPDRVGGLIYKTDGKGHAGWSIDYDRKVRDDDERGVHLQRHRFVPGEYVTFSDGQEEHAFQIKSVEPFKLAQAVWPGDGHSA